MKIDRGFAAIEGVLILIIVGILGFTGWYVWHSKQSTDKTNSASTIASSSTTASTSAWKTETNSTYGISYKYPADSGWQSTVTEYKPESPDYKLGVRLRANVNYTKLIDCGINCGSAFLLGVNQEGSSQDPGTDWHADFSSNVYTMTKKAIIKSGISGTEWDFTTTHTDSVSETNTYYFMKGDLVYVIYVNYGSTKSDKVDLTTTGHKVFDSFEIR